MGTAVTVTVNVHDAVRDCASVAVQVTGVEPTGKTLPEAGAQLTATGGWPF
jgi:hypothetical protein